MIPATAAMRTALEDIDRPLMLLLNFDFANGNDRVTTNGFDLTWNTFTWSGSAVVTQVGSMEKSADTLISSMSVTLGVGPRHPSRVLDILQESRGRTCKIYIAAIADDGKSVIADPIHWTTRRMQPGAIRGGRDTYTAQITLESRFNRSRVRAPRTASHPEQLLIDANDDSFIDIGQLPSGDERYRRVLKSGFPGA